MIDNVTEQFCQDMCICRTVRVACSIYDFRELKGIDHTAAQIGAHHLHSKQCFRFSAKSLPVIITSGSLPEFGELFIPCPCIGKHSPSAGISCQPASLEETTCFQIIRLICVFIDQIECIAMFFQCLFHIGIINDIRDSIP